MRHSALLGYQLLIGLSDTSTGVLLIAAPKLTLQLMSLHVSGDTLPFISFIGAFVLSIGLASLYGALLTFRGDSASQVEVVWLLTALARGTVSIFIVASILSGTLESGWVTVGLFDGTCVVIQAIGLNKGWLRNVPH